ncbi:Oidioi.mRNA.OKI2018_I69.chr2.g8395.t1.cds [Oikopleura dioica]|uniref:mitogen-activated protein kinase kinase n=1 Tax=Oikopleura dioica TaxID=34765 RepID=A0ABN7T942_OIKDI|nr:Oidioi.mRNA.OKI2018_I69.chr2.g8395.t1.cds [Oikopleura dioica]
MPGGDLAQFFEKMLNNAYIHGKNIKHRDIKPENILLSADGQQVKIADFNISRESKETFMTTGIAGTDPYLAPEMINTDGNSAQVSCSQDVWALGIIFQMLCTFRIDFKKILSQKRM